LAFGITAYVLLKPLRAWITRTDELLVALSALFVARHERPRAAPTGGGGLA